MRSIVLTISSRHVRRRNVGVRPGSAMRISRASSPALTFDHHDCGCRIVAHRGRGPTARVYPCVTAPYEIVPGRHEFPSDTVSCLTPTQHLAYTGVPSLRLCRPRCASSLSTCAPGPSRLPGDGQHQMPAEGRIISLPVPASALLVHLRDSASRSGVRSRSPDLPPDLEADMGRWWCVRYGDALARPADLATAR